MIEDVVKLPPHDLDAEESVLGSLLIDPEAGIKVIGNLAGPDFYREKHRWVFECCEDLQKREIKVDQITVANELARREQLEASGGAAFLSHLVSQVPSTVHVEHYADIVKHLALMRKLITVANQIAGRAYEAPPDGEGTVAWAESVIANLGNGHEEHSVTFMEDMLEIYPNHLMERAEQIAHLPPFTMGWSEFDDLAIFRNGTASLIGGLPGVGKTIFAENIRDRACQIGLNPAYFHNELQPMQVFNRLMCRMMKLANDEGAPRAPRFKDLEQGMYYDHDAMYEAIDEISTWPGRYADVYCPGWSINKICARMRQLALDKRIDVVIIDYLQQIPLGDFMGKNGLNHAQAVGAAVQVLKDTAANLPGQPPVVLFSQLNREGQIRDSGEPFEKANLYVHIQHQWKATAGKCIDDCVFARKDCRQPCVELRILKNTFGESGTVTVFHDPPRFKFYVK